MKTVFITGASGLMGAELTDTLLSKGYNVIGTDNKPNSFVGNQNYEFEGVDKVFVYSADLAELNDYDLYAGFSRYGTPSRAAPPS